MLKMPLDDFIEEIKAELASTPELTDEHIIKWEEGFKEALKRGIKEVKADKTGKMVVTVKDESDIFAFADGYFAAVLNDETEKYFKSL